MSFSLFVHAHGGAVAQVLVQRLPHRLAARREAPLPVLPLLLLLRLRCCFRLRLRCCLRHLRLHVSGYVTLAEH